VMQQSHLLARIRYIEMNPVRGGLVVAPDKWPWSSALAHMSGRGDGFVDPAPLVTMAEEAWKSFLTKALDTGIAEASRKDERTGRPMGDEAFIEDLERITGLTLKVGKPGPESKREN